MPQYKIDKSKVIGPPIAPLPPAPSIYGVDPKYVKKRASELPNMVSIKISELFPDIPKPLWPPPNPKAIRDATEEALENVDMSPIKGARSVNILG